VKQLLPFFFTMFVLGFFVSIFIFRLRADKEICQTYFPKVSLYACMMSDKTRVLP